MEEAKFPDSEDASLRNEMGPHPRAGAVGDEHRHPAEHGAPEPDEARHDSQRSLQSEHLRRDDFKEVLDQVQGQVHSTQLHILEELRREELSQGEAAGLCGAAGDRHQ